MGNQIYFKITGYVDLDILNMFDNNSKMGKGIYFKIARYADLDMLNIFEI